MHKNVKAEQIRLLFVNAAIIVITIAAMSFVCVYSVAKELTDDRTFAKGITINGLDLSGMTFSDAQRRLERYCEDELGDLLLELTYGDATYSYAVSELGGVIDVADTLEQAFNIGKTAEGTDTSLGSIDMSTELWLQISVDREKLESNIAAISDEWDVPASNPVAEFDPDTRTFTYHEGESGLVIDVDACVDQIEGKLATGDFSSFELISRVDQPDFTVDDLRRNTELVASFSSETSNNENRNININLMCSYVNGYTIMPGDTLSINELVGERTFEKGFLEAPAIMDGKRLENDIGGGICQLSGTLYNAALWANLEIVERWPHSWPSNYLDIGLDSTLDWNSQKDLKLKNPSDYPVYIAAWLENRNMNAANVLRVEIYGAPLPEGVTINIRSEIVETIEPEPVKVTYTSSLSSGRSEVVIEERIGYRTKVWRDFYYNGVLIDSEPMSSSYYRPIQGEIRVGRGGGSNQSPTNTFDASYGNSPNYPTDDPVNDWPEVPTDPPLPTTPPPEDNDTPPPTDPQFPIGG